MLRIKLFRGFAIVIVLFSMVSGFFAVNTLKRRTLEVAQNRVRLDLSSAWSVYDNRLDQIETVTRMAASKQLVQECAVSGAWDNPEMRVRLERLRSTFNLDFMGLVAPDGRVMMRTTPPYRSGDYRVSDSAVAEALRGNARSCTSLFAKAELLQECDTLAEQAYLQLEDTPRARMKLRDVETRGMVLESAVPVMQGPNVVGVVYGGVLVNRNHALVDTIQDVVFRNEDYRGRQFGTATIFLHDSRVATTVRLPNGNRALGTRVSKEVADQVLDNNRPWIGEAFVVDDWYLSAYEPIHDGTGQVVGMLYVGILKQPFLDAARQVAMRYGLLSLLAVIVALVVAFIMAGHLAAPIHRLVAASHQMTEGNRPAPISTAGACRETADLVAAFNRMASTLAEREENLRGLNRSYMETLGFVSHELKSPVATIMNYAYLLRQKMLGPLTEKQEKAVRAVESGSTRIVEMVRHYLNLSRIENGELDPVPTRVAVLEDVVAPLLDQIAADVETRGIQIDNRIDPAVLVKADLNMLREVFENLISNAIKYGRDGGNVALRATPRDGLVEFSVWNDGEGIPEDRRGQLFQKFSRIEGGKAAKQKGTGLGLFITKCIVDAHGGAISARSQPGEWAEFIFTLPRYMEDSTS